MVRQDVRYFASELDDGRYVNVPATGRDDDRYVTFLVTTIGSIPRNDRTASFQIISMKLKCSVKCDANNISFPPERLLADRLALSL